MNDLFESLARQALDFPSEITPIPQRNASADPAALGFELFSASSDLSWAELHPAASSSVISVPRLLPSNPEGARSSSHPQPSFRGPAVSSADDGLGRLDQAFREGPLEDDPGSADTPRHDRHAPSAQPAAAYAQHGFSVSNTLPGVDAHASLSEVSASSTREFPPAFSSHPGPPPHEGGGHRATLPTWTTPRDENDPDDGAVPARPHTSAKLSQPLNHHVSTLSDAPPHDTTRGDQQSHSTVPSTHVSNDPYSPREPLAGARSLTDERITFERRAESPYPQPTIERTESSYPSALIATDRRPISAPVDAVQTRPDRHTHTSEGVGTETAPPPAASSTRSLLQDESHEPPAQSIERQPTVGIPGAPPIQSAIQPVGTVDNEAWVPETQDRHTESAVSYPLSQEKAAYSEQRQHILVPDTSYPSSSLGSETDRIVPSLCVPAQFAQADRATPASIASALQHALPGLVHPDQTPHISITNRSEFTQLQTPQSAAATGVPPQFIPEPTASLAPALEQLQDGRTEPEMHHSFAEGNTIAAAELSGSPHNQPAQGFGPQSQAAEAKFADLSTFPDSKDAAHSLSQPHRHQPIAAADKPVLPDLADGDGTKPSEEFPLGSQAAQALIGTAAIPSVALPRIANEPALPDQRQPIAADDKAAAHLLPVEQALQLAQKFRLPAQPAHSAITNSQHTAYISDQTGQFQPAVADRPLSPGSQPHHALGFFPPHEIAPPAIFALSEQQPAQPLEGTDATAHAQSDQPATPTHPETMASSSRASTAFAAERNSEPEGSHPQAARRPSAYLSDSFPQPLKRAEVSRSDGNTASPPNPAFPGGEPAEPLGTSLQSRPSAASEPRPKTSNASPNLPPYIGATSEPDRNGTKQPTAPAILHVPADQPAIAQATTLDPSANAGIRILLAEDTPATSMTPLPSRTPEPLASTESTAPKLQPDARDPIAKELQKNRLPSSPAVAGSHSAFSPDLLTPPSRNIKAQGALLVPTAAPSYSPADLAGRHLEASAVHPAHPFTPSRTAAGSDPTSSAAVRSHLAPLLRQVFTGEQLGSANAIALAALLTALPTPQETDYPAQRSTAASLGDTAAVIVPPAQQLRTADMTASPHLRSTQSSPAIPSTRETTVFATSQARPADPEDARSASAVSNASSARQSSAAVAQFSADRTSAPESRLPGSLEELSAAATPTPEAPPTSASYIAPTPALAPQLQSLSRHIAALPVSGATSLHPAGPWVTLHEASRSSIAASVAMRESSTPGLSGAAGSDALHPARRAVVLAVSPQHTHSTDAASGDAHAVSASTSEAHPRIPTQPDPENSVPRTRVHPEAVAPVETMFAARHGEVRAPSSYFAGEFAPRTHTKAADHLHPPTLHAPVVETTERPANASSVTETTIVYAVSPPRSRHAALSVESPSGLTLSPLVTSSPAEHSVAAIAGSNRSFPPHPVEPQARNSQQADQTHVPGDLSTSLLLAPEGIAVPQQAFREARPPRPTPIATHKIPPQIQRPTPSSQNAPPAEMSSPHLNRDSFRRIAASADAAAASLSLSHPSARDFPPSQPSPLMVAATYARQPGTLPPSSPASHTSSAAGLRPESPPPITWEEPRNSAHGLASARPNLAPEAALPRPAAPGLVVPAKLSSENRRPLQSELDSFASANQLRTAIPARPFRSYSERFFSRRAEPVSTPQPRPPLRIDISRIDIAFGPSAVDTPARSGATRPKPTLSLGQYLRRRSGGR